MPAIKKKWMKTNREDSSVVEDDSGKNESVGTEDKEMANPESAKVEVKKPAKRSLPHEPGMLKGLDGEVLLQKRKRFTPPAELKLSEWLDNNLEKRTDETIHLPLLYKYYTELCQADGSEILDVPAFNRMVKVKFGKAFGVQASSIYKTVIKERKVGEKKKSGSGVKLKEILIEAINHFGNPWQGVRFFNLKLYVSTRCPALQIDSKPKILKRALEMGTHFGYIDLAKGIGMAGFYRLPGAVEPPPKPKVPTKKGGEVDGEPKSDEEGKAKENEDAVDEAAPDLEVKEDENAKAKKAKKVQPWSYSKISYSNPSRIEDTFPLAITYQSAPKAVSVPRIRRYIQELYGEEVTDNRWRKTLETGVDKGFWEHISGSGITGRIHLLMDDFDPNSEQLDDRICAAIIACHDPKVASANQIKKYVTKYHADFKVDQRPERFKKALQRALEKKMIRQLSGLGANGSFQLVFPFTPSPTVLAGEDESDEEDDDDDDEEQAYVSRGTKSRGVPKKEATKRQDSSKPSRNAAPSIGRKTDHKSSKNDKVAGGAGKGKSTSQRKQDMKRSSPSKTKGHKAKKSRERSLSPLTDEEDVEEPEPEYTPRKSQSRGGSPRQSNPAKAEKTSKKDKNVKKNDSARTLSRSPKKAPKYNETDDDDNDEAEEENAYTPRKSASRGGLPKSASKSSQNGSRSPSKSSSSKAKGGARRSAAVDGSEDDEGDVEPEYTPKKSTSRKGRR